MTNIELGKQFIQTQQDLIEAWGDAGYEIIGLTAQMNKSPMSMDEFLDKCTACGGNWGGMLLSGIHILWPEIWDAIPDDMGVFAFSNICAVLFLCGVKTWEGKEK